MTRTFNIVFWNDGAQDETQFDLDDGDFGFLATQLLDLWTEFIRENHPERMDDPAQMEIIEAYEVKPLTARTAAEKICKGLMDLSESYSKDGYEMLANGVFTIASALQSTINDGEFGVE